MRKILSIILALIVVNLISCRSCNDNPDIKPDAREAGVDVKEDVVTNTVFSNSEWEITLPTEWTQESIDLSSSLNTRFIAASSTARAAVVLSSEKTEAIFDQKAIEFIRGMRSEGFAIETITYRVMNCSRYIIISAIKDGVYGTIWLTVNETTKISYELSCGGEMYNVDSFSNDCEFIAESFKLKNLKTCRLK